MEKTPTTNHARLKITLGTVGLILGGLAPLITGIVGIWSYAKQGYFISKTGELIDGPSGILMSGFFILAGLGMIIFAIWKYRRESN